MTRQQRAVRRFRERRQEMLNEIRNQRCHDCRKKYPVECMQFDHVRGKKLFTIGSGVMNSWAAILREVSKCEVVCSNCHAVRTALRRKHCRWRKGK